jgi:NADH dehydrogenase [ubiquinone] 1 alpha subcomplex assembly factor 5
LVQLDFCKEMLNRDIDLEVAGSHRCDTYRLTADEENPLPFPNGTFDVVLSSQSMHWVNDLPGLFKEVKRVLKPDGCFMFSMVGGQTLQELRISMHLAELEREGGVGVHVGPFVELSDVGSLLQNAGFSLPTIDVDTVRVSYPNVGVLMEHLQRMGEGNASLRRRNYTGKDVFLAAACIYDEMFKLEDSEGQEEESGIEASAQVISAIGWSPHASQQQPSQRGSAQHRVGEIVTKTSGKGSS